MVDLHQPRYTLNEIGNLCKVHVSTVWRWCLNGVRGRKLRSVIIAGRRYVMKDDFDDFIAGMNEPTGPKSTPSKRAEKRSSAAEKKLDEIGIG